MTHHRILLCLATTGLCSACVLDPAASGALQAGASDDGSTGTLDDDGMSSSPDDDTSDDGDSTGDAMGPEPTRWSSEIVVPGTSASPCGVAIDGTGRVAVSVLAEQWNGQAYERHASVRVFAADGTPSGSLTADAEVFDSIAFASDGTLRIRGSRFDDDDHNIEWTRAYDADLEQTWSQEYYGHHAGALCDSSARGIVVHADDRVTTYEYRCENEGNGPCGTSIVRGHAPGGSVSWTHEAGGGPGFMRAVLAAGTDGSTFAGAVLTYPDSDEVELRKLDASGNELWMTVVPGFATRTWAAADGGVFVLTFFRPKEIGDWDYELHRLSADGESVDVVDLEDDTLLAPSADATDFFRLDAPTTLQRLSGEVLGSWDAPASVLLAPHISAVRDDRRFVTVGRYQQPAAVPDEMTLWVGTVTLP